MPDRFLLSPFFLDRPEPGLAHLAGEGWGVDAPELPAAGQLERLAAVHRGIASWVAETLTVGQRPVVLAGDCCAAIPVLAGVQRAGIDPLLLWFDAHGDFNTPETTPSGFLGGMPLAMLVGRGDETLCRAAGVDPLLEERVLLTDARALDQPREAAAVASASLTHVPQVGALLDLPLGDGPLWVHWDTDVLTPAAAPAQNYPAPGGPSPEELGRVFRRLRATGRVAAVSVSCWNPALDASRSTERVCLDLLGELLGR